MSFNFGEQRRNSETNSALHRLMNMAREAPAEKAKLAWNLVLKAVLMAIQRSEYHISVHERFAAECPSQYKDLHFRVRRETNLPDPKFGLPLRRGRIERKRETLANRRAIQAVAMISATA